MAATPPPYQSILAEHPEHLKALGMISIELANLDIFMGAVFAAILKVPRHAGQQVYLTPRGAMARIDTFNAAVNAMMDEKSGTHKHLTSLADRAKRILQKRHQMLHDSWGTDSHGVVRRPLTKRESSIPCPLTELTRQVRDIQNLIGDFQAAEKALERGDALPPK